MKVALLLIGLSVLYTLQSLFCKLYSANAKNDPASVNPVYSVVYGLVVGGLALVWSGFTYHPHAVTVWTGLLAAVVLFIYNLALIKASSLGPYSLVMICNLFGGILLPILFSAVVFQETLQPLHIFATVIMLAAFIVINCKGLNLKEGGKSYYLWCLLLFAANGLYGILLKYQQTVLNGDDHDEMIITAFLASAVVSFVYLLLRRGKKSFGDFKVGKKAAVFMFSAGIIAMVAVELVLVALNLAPAAVVYTVDNGGIMVLSILSSALLFKERPQKHQWIGMAMALCSIILFSL